MASFLRSRHAGGLQHDLSAGLRPELFAPDDLDRLGINSQIIAVAYDPVQSLLALGTSESLYGGGQIYIFGHGRVRCRLALPRRASVRILQFVADRLVSLDSKHDLIAWDLATTTKLCQHAIPGAAVALVTDPMLDWAFIGLQNGEIIAYDLDRAQIAPLRLPNFWREKFPKAHLHAIVSMQLHPRDVGQLLIGYTEGIVLYSFKQNAATRFFQYELPAGAMGGNGDSRPTNVPRKPHLIQATWHPTGTFILGVFNDGSLVFFDGKDGRIVMARSLSMMHVDKPNSRPASEEIPEPKIPISKVVWCCKQNPEDTGLLVLGGTNAQNPTRDMSFIELGPTPVYATSSWTVLASYLEGKRHLTLSIPPGADVVNVCLIPRASPHFTGAQDPLAILVLLGSGELLTLSFPSGHAISPTNQLPPSVTFIHPFVTSLAVSNVDRERWLGMTEIRQHGPELLRGGAEGQRHLRRYEARNIVQMAHADGIIRIWDSGHADEIENSTVLQVDMARALERYSSIDVCRLSMACTTGELAAGTRMGEVVVFRWGGNPTHGRDGRPVQTRRREVTDISSRTEPTLKEGLQPFVLYDMAQGPISALRLSEVGFVGVGSEGGGFAILDLRGPAVMLATSTADFARGEKQGSLLKRTASLRKPSMPAAKDDWPVCIEFGVMTLDDDKYSSIACFVGTNAGKLVTFKILPQNGGHYVAEFAGLTDLGEKVISINPMDADTGKPASATGPTVASLRDGCQTNGVLVIATQTSIHILRPANGKSTRRAISDTAFCDAACLSIPPTSTSPLPSTALITLHGDSSIHAFSLPSLKELASAPLPALDKSRISSSIVTPLGTVFAWTGPSEVAMLNAWGTGQTLTSLAAMTTAGASADRLYNPELTVPARPTISNLAWISGTQYLSPSDLDLLIGGPDRPPSKRALAAKQAEERAAARLGGQGGNGSSTSTGGSTSPRVVGEPEGWGEYMTRQLNERTERLNVLGDGMDRLQEQSQGWAEDVSKFVGRQKRNFVVGAVRSGFGL